MQALKKILITTFEIAPWLWWHYPFVHRDVFRQTGTFFFKKKSLFVYR